MNGKIETDEIIVKLNLILRDVIEKKHKRMSDDAIECFIIKYVCEAKDIEVTRQDEFIDVQYFIDDVPYFIKAFV